MPPPLPTEETHVFAVGTHWLHIVVVEIEAHHRDSNEDGHGSRSGTSNHYNYSTRIHKKLLHMNDAENRVLAMKLRMKHAENGVFARGMHSNIVVFVKIDDNTSAAISIGNAEARIWESVWQWQRIHHQNPHTPLLKLRLRFHRGLVKLAKCCVIMRRTELELVCG